MKHRELFMLIILDGWGLDANSRTNAVSIAKTPHLDALFKEFAHTRLTTSGQAVGLPDGVMGNSEVGHLNLGAGRIVYQDLLRINRAIEDGSFQKNEVFLDAIRNVKSTGGALHLIGLLSDGGVHSHQAHLNALLKLAAESGLKEVFVHAILDGRDTPPNSGVGYIRELEATIEEIGCGRIATLCGRYFAMDRDNRWDRIQKAYNLYIRGEGERAADPVEAVNASYERKETDEFVRPIAICRDGDESPDTIKNGDALIFFNFRADRAREITRAFTDSRFEHFQTEDRPNFAAYVCMTRFDEKFDLPIAFAPTHKKNILGEILGARGLKQLRIAETEKYPHVTYFFNGGEEIAFPLEERCLIPSPRDVATYDLKPEMSAREVTRELLNRMDDDTYDFIVLNFANMDMVGHTGVIEAAVTACETVDGCLGDVISRLRNGGGRAIITADHGNAETMVDAKGTPHTAHTTNPVPLILVDDNLKNAALNEGKLANVAPTILHLMGIETPEEMTEQSLLS